jgi:exosortase
MKKSAAQWLDLMIIAGLFSVFHWLGNTADTAFFGRSVLRWMLIRWNDSTFYAGDYSHGWLIPLVSIAALWRSRAELAVTPKAAWWPAFCVIAAAMLVHLAGSRAQLPRLSLAAMIMLLWAIPAFVYGRRVARIAAFPAAYLIFCIPLNFLDSLAFPLRIAATNLSACILNGINIPAEPVGTAILSPTGAFSLDIADPCSGIKSLLAITAVTVAYSYFFQKKMLHRAVLVLASGALAVAGNVARIVTLALFATIFGQERAFSFYHDYSGYMVFPVAVILMVSLDKGLIRASALVGRIKKKPASTGLD